MTSPNLDNLVGTGQLKREPPNAKEFAGLVRSARARLRWHGYRSDTRFIVFQCLPHTLGVGPEVWRVLSHCHNLRNRGEYEGFLDLNHRIIVDLVQAAGILLQEVDNLGPVV